VRSIARKRSKTRITAGFPRVSPAGGFRVRGGSQEAFVASERAPARAYMLQALLDRDAASHFAAKTP